MRCSMFLDNEAKTTSRGSSLVSRWLGRLREITLASILCELAARALRTARSRCHSQRRLCCLALARATRSCWCGAFRAGGFLRCSLLEARAELRHEIEHACVGRLFLGFLELRLFTLHLRPDHLHEIRAIIVGVAARVEWLSKVVDELLRHLQLLWPHLIAIGEAVF